MLGGWGLPAVVSPPKETCPETCLWRPVAGDLHGATRAIDSIAKLLENPPPIYNGRLVDPALAVSLTSREPGFAVFFSYLHAATGVEAWKQLAVTQIDLAMDAVPLALAQRRPFLAYGVAGLGWAIAHLDGWILEDVGDGLDDIDAMLIELVAADAVTNFALPKGLVGYGVYALERLPRPSAKRLLELVVAKLVALARPHGAGIAWEMVDDLISEDVRARHPDGIWIRGMFEGTASAVALLAAAEHVGARHDRSREIIDRGLAYVWSSVSTSPAWGVGDLGIAAAIVATVDGPQREIAIARARALTSIDPPSVSNPNLVVGAAGTALTFQRLHAATGDDAFRIASRAWFERVIALYDETRGGGGFRFWQDPKQAELIPELDVGWIVDPGLLSGAAGVGLALLAATTTIEPRWDRLMSLSRAP